MFPFIFFLFYSENKLKEVSDLRASSLEMYSKAQKERLENLDQANQEIDGLRKSIEKLQSDLEGESGAVFWDLGSYYLLFLFIDQE